jgi:hypothetical protein
MPSSAWRMHRTSSAPIGMHSRGWMRTGPRCVCGWGIGAGGGGTMWHCVWHTCPYKLVVLRAVSPLLSLNRRTYAPLPQCSASWLSRPASSTPLSPTSAFGAITPPHRWAPSISLPSSLVSASSLSLFFVLYRLSFSCLLPFSSPLTFSQQFPFSKK